MWCCSLVTVKYNSFLCIAHATGIYLLRRTRPCKGLLFIGELATGMWLAHNDNRQKILALQRTLHGNLRSQHIGHCWCWCCRGFANDSLRLNGAGAPVMHTVLWQLHSAATASSLLINVASAIRLSYQTGKIGHHCIKLAAEDADANAAIAGQKSQVEHTCSKNRRGSDNLPPTQCCLRMVSISSPAATPPVMLEMCKTGPGGNKCW